MPDDRFRVLFDHSSDSHLIFDETGITDCNDATIRLLGARSRAEVLALHPAVLSPEIQPDGRRSDEKSREMDGTARQRGWHRFEWVHRRIDGTPVPVEVTLNSVVIDGRPAMVVVWHDLTERKRMEDDLRRASREVAAANAELRAANDRMKSELQAAALVQRSLLPQGVPDLGSVAVAWRFRPCVELAGDLLDVFRLDESRVGFYVLDVTGHGVASSLLSVAVSHALSPHTARSAFRQAGGSGDAAFAEPYDVVRRLNEDFAERGGTLQLFTICCGTLDLRTKELRYVTAGHPGPLRVTRNGTAQVLNVPGLPVGVMRGVAYEGASVRLEVGDRFFVYSDGVPEALSAAEEPFGDERMAQTALASRSSSLDACVDRIVDAAVAWSAPKDPHDDISLVAIEVLDA